MKKTFTKQTFTGWMQSIICAILFVGLVAVSTGAKAQVISESFEGAGWAVPFSSQTGASASNSASTGGTAVGVSAPSYGTITGTLNAGWFYFALSTGNATSVRNTNNPNSTNTTYTSTRGALLAGTSSSFVCTPFMSGGVSVVTLWVYAANNAQFNIGVATQQTVSTKDLTSSASASQTSITTANGIWTNSQYWASGASTGTASASFGGLPNLIKSTWTSIAFTTNIPSTAGAYIKFQRIAQGSVSIDDIQVYGAPTIASNPSNATACGTGSNSQTFTASFGGMAPAPYNTYQWQFNDGSGWANATNGASGNNYFTNATTATITVNNITAASNGWQFRCQAESNTTTTAAILTVNTATAITGQPSATASYNQNATPADLTVSATGTSLTYQWYSNTSASNTGGTSLGSGAQNASYTPSTASLATSYYYCVVHGSCGTDVSSSVATVNVCTAPVFNAALTDNQIICVGASASALDGTASLSPTYQWYSNTSKTNVGGTSISGANSATYTPSTSVAGSYYYYVTASNGSCVATSNAILFTVSSAPSISTNPSTSVQTYTIGESAASLSVSATGVGLSYQWFSNTSASNTGGSSISGANSATYTPSTSTAGVLYYYCEVSGCSSTVKSAVSGSYTVVTQAVGDLQAVSIGGVWGTAGTWKSWVVTAGVGSWTGAGVVPTALKSVWINQGGTVTLAASGACKDLHVTNGTLLSNTTITGSINTLTISGSSVEVNTGGVVGSNVVGDLANGLAFSIPGTTTISGTADTIHLAKLMLSADNANLTISHNVKLHYHATNGTTGLAGNGTAFGVIGTAYPATVAAINGTITISNGSTVTMDQMSGFSLGGSQASLYYVNLTLNVNGTLKFLRGKPSGEAASTATNGNFVLNSYAGYASTVNVGLGGSIQATEFYPNGNATIPFGTISNASTPPLSDYVGSVSTINVTGSFSVDSVADFSKNAAQTVTGTGTFTINNTQSPVIKLGAVTGMSSSAGPILTTSKSLPSNLVYSYEGYTGAKQNTGDALPSTVSSLRINNRLAGLTLDNNVTVSDSVSLKSGIIDVNGKTITLPSSCIIGYLTGSDTSYLNGAVNRTLASTTLTALNFPTGSATKYSPVTLNVTQTAATATTYTATAFVGGTTPSHGLPTGTPQTELIGVSSNRYYQLSSSIANIASATVTLPYSTTDETGGGMTVGNGSNVKIAGFSTGTDWVNLNQSTTGSAGFITSENITTLGDFTLGNGYVFAASPTLTAAVGATVDADIIIPISVNDPTWIAAITGVTYGSYSLTGADYTIAGDGLSITLKPSAGTNGVGLRLPGTQTLTIKATGYQDAFVSQAIGFGAVASLKVVNTITATGSVGAALTTQPIVNIVDQYDNLVTTSTLTVSAAGSTGWTIGGTTTATAVAGVATFSGLTATETAAVTGATMTFTTTAPSLSFTSAAFNIIGPATFRWKGGTSLLTWVDPTAWINTTASSTAYPVAVGSPTVVNSSYDTYIFDGTNNNNAGGSGAITLTLTSAVQTMNIGKIVLQGNADVTFNYSAARTLNIGNSGFASNSGAGTVCLSIASGSILRTSGSTSSFSITLLDNSSASITGTLATCNFNSVSGTFNNVTLQPGVNNSKITFNSGSTYESNSASSATKPFGSTVNNSVIFKSGATYKYTKGGDVFGGTTTNQTSNNVVVFETGSLCQFNQTSTTAMTLDNRTFANLQVSTNCSPTKGTAGFSIDNITVDAAATFTIAATDSVTGSFNNIKGNITSAGIFRFNPASTSTLNFVGTAAQSITTTGTGTLNFAANTGSININNAAGVSLGASTNLTLAGNLILTNGTFDAGTNTLAFTSPAGKGLIIGSTGSPKYRVGISGTTINAISPNTVTNGATSGHKLGFIVAGTFSSFSNTTLQSWPLINYTTIVNAFDATNTTLDVTGITNSLGGGAFSLSFAGNAVTLVFTPATTISMTVASSYEYNGAPRTLTATVNSGGTITYNYTGTTSTGASTSTTYGPTATAPTHVGSYHVSASVAANGTYSSASSSTYDFTITRKAITVTGEDNPAKVYDATVNSPVTPAISPLGGIQGTDVAHFTQVYNNASIGSGKTITPSGFVTDGNNGYNYDITFVQNFAGIITPSAYYWSGNTTDWNTDANWSGGHAPTASSDVTIPTGASVYPVISGSATAHNILNESGATIGLGTGNLTITGAISGAGLLVGSSTGTLTMNSSSANTLNFRTTGSSDTLVGTLTLNGSGMVTLGTGVGITSLLSLNNSSSILNLNNNHLTLKSTSLANTAEVGAVAHGAFITGGNVTVERYIPKEFRNYRDLGASVANAGSVFANWQESGAAGNNVNNGFFITGTAAKYSPYIPGKIFEPISGLDYTTTGNPSMYTYNGTTWPAVNSTKALSLNPFQGYRAIVRGARNFNMGTNPNVMPTATTVRTTGKLVTGDVTITTAGTTVTDNSAYNSSFALNSGSSAYSLIANPYACPVQWSKVLAHSSIYNTYWYLDPTYQDPSGNQRYITVQYSGGVTIVTPNPNGGSSADASFDYIQSGQAIMVNNYGNGTPSISFREADKTTGATNNDVFKQTTPSLMSIELYKNNSLADATVANFNNNFTKAIGTEDASKMMNSAENISITESNNDLSIDGLPTPSVNDVLPVRMGQLKANTTYQLKADISNFNTAGLQAYVRDNILNTEVAAGNMISFTPTSVDVQSYKDRFSIVFKQSKVVPIVTVKGSISVFPNPVTAKSFKVQTSNIAAGKYNVVMVNTFGQEVMSTPITHVEGSNTETITMSKALTSGVYTLVLKSAEGKTVYQTELLAK